MLVGELLELRARNKLEYLMENATESLHRRAPPRLELRQPDSTGTRRYFIPLASNLFWTGVVADGVSFVWLERADRIAPHRSPATGNRQPAAGLLSPLLLTPTDIGDQAGERFTHARARCSQRGVLCGCEQTQMAAPMSSASTSNYFK